MRDADGEISVRGAYTTIKLLKGVAYTPNNRKVDVSDGTLIIPWGHNGRLSRNWISVFPVRHRQSLKLPETSLSTF